MKLAQGWRATLCGVLAWGACLHQAGAQDAPAVQVPHELLLQFRADAPESARDAALASVQARVVDTLRPGLLRLRLPRHQPEAVVARQLMRQAAVEFAEPNLVFQAVEGVPSTERCPERLIVVLDPALSAGESSGLDEGAERADASDTDTDCRPAPRLGVAGADGATLAQVVRALDQLADWKAARPRAVVAAQADWGHPEDSQALRQAVQRLGASGLMLLAAGAASAEAGGPALYPAALQAPHVLGLATVPGRVGQAARLSGGVLARLALQHPEWDALQLKEAVRAVTDPAPLASAYARSMGDY